MTAFEDYISAEMPKRSPLETNSTVSYDGDPNDPGAPAALKGAPLGTWFREETAAKWWRKIGSGPTDWEESGGAGVEEVRTLYVGKHGDDGNAATSVSSAKLTIGAAITAAIALVPTGASPVVIRVLDSGTYDEAITLPAYVSLDGPNAHVTRSQTAVDTITANDGCHVRLRKASCGGNGGFAITTASAATGVAFFDIGEITQSSNGEPISNRGGSATVVVKSDLVTSTYRALIESKSGAPMVIDIEAMILNGSAVYGLLNGFGAPVTGRIGSLTKGSAGYTGTFGMSGGIPTTLICGEIEADTAVDAPFGNTMNVVAGKITGAITGSGTLNILTADATFGDVAGPVSSVDNTLPRYDGATGKLIQGSAVTLSDADAMVFPTTGSISKPAPGATTEVFGTGHTINTAINSTIVGTANSIADGVNGGTALGAAVHIDSNYSIGVGVGVDIGANSDFAVCVGQNCDIAANCAQSTAIGGQARVNHPDGVAIGKSATVHLASSGDNTGGVAVGSGARVGQSSAGGADAGVAVGLAAAVDSNAANSIAIGASAAVGSSSTNAIAIGSSSTVSSFSVEAIAIGYQATSAGGTAVGKGANGGAGGSALGKSASATGANACAMGNSASAGFADGVAIGSTSIANQNAVSIGQSSRADLESVCIGQSGLVDTSYAVGVGQNVTARGDSAVIIGHDAVGADTGNQGIAIGRLAKSYDTGAIVVGAYGQTNTAAEYSVSIGHSVFATHADAIAIGRSAITTASGRCNIGTVGGSYDKELQIGKGLGVFGATPPAAQPAKVNDPSGGATIDAEARTAINAIIDILEGAGLASAV